MSPELQAAPNTTTALSLAARHTPATRDGSGAMFDHIAHRYDLLNRILSLGVDQRWRRLTVRALALADGPTQVLDLATGTLDLAIKTARHYPAAHVVGLDPSPRMLAVGRCKLQSSALSERIRLIRGDAQNLPFPNACFDAVTMAFGIRNVPDRLMALCEMRRVTRPGGRIAILELGDPPPGLLGALARIHVHVVVPRIGALLSGAREYRYLHESIARFPPPDEFVALLRQAGLEALAVTRLTFGVATLFVAAVPGGAL